MSNLNEELKKLGITIIEMPTREVKAIALLLGNQYFIGYDPAKFETKDELEEAIKHELMHIKTATLHRMNEFIPVCERMVDEVWKE